MSNFNESTILTKGNPLISGALLAKALVASAVVISSASFATPSNEVNHSNITPADIAENAVDNTLQQKIVDKRGELLATQPGVVEIETHKSLAHEKARSVATDVKTSPYGSQDVYTNNDINYAEVTPAQLLIEPVEITLQKKIVGDNGELLATQPGRIEVNQSTSLANSQNNSQYDMNRIEARQLSRAPTLVGESGSTINTQTAPSTLRQKVKDKRGELLATQPGEIKILERRRISTK